MSTFQPPELLPAACHTSSRLLPSTTTSSRKPGKGSLWASPPRPRPRAGQRAWRDSGTLGVTLKIVSHVEFTAGARGAQGGCEDAGLLCQLPPGPLHRQEVPWGRAGLSELIPENRGHPPIQRPSTVKRGRAGTLVRVQLQGRLQAALGRALRPHQRPRWRPCQGSRCPGPGDAPTAAAPRWHPPSPRPRGTRSPWCLQWQPV